MILKFATIYPAASPWGQVLTQWARSLKEKSGGRLELQFFFGGQKGDEGATVSQCKAGLLAGCAVTGVGLGRIYTPILALQMPGLFSTWAKLDAARDTLRGEFEQGLKTAGFTSLGWHDVGLSRPLSKGIAVRVADDLQGQKPWQWRDDLMGPGFYAVIGGVSGVLLNVPEVLPILNTGAINALFQPVLLAEQLQWTGRLDHVTDLVCAMSIGAIVISNKVLDALPDELEAIVRDTGKIASAMLMKRIRNEDDAAFGRFKTKHGVVTLSAEERGKWSTVFRAMRQKFAQGTFPPELVSRLEGMAG